jgi:hypothetical protein
MISSSKEKRSDDKWGYWKGIYWTWISSVLHGTKTVAGRGLAISRRLSAVRLALSLFVLATGIVTIIASGSGGSKGNNQNNQNNQNTPTGTIIVSSGTTKIDDGGIYNYLPIGVKGKSYTAEVTVAVSGGPSACSSYNYVWTRLGSIPGLEFSNPSSDRLLISGTPTESGHFTIGFKVEETNCSYAVSELDLDIYILDNIDLSGDWNFHFVVTAAEGVCSPDDIGVESDETITITQGNSMDPDIYYLEFAGFQGSLGNIIFGWLTNWNTVQVSGDYPEDGGTTTTTHNLKILTANMMVGEEEWSWSGGNQSCPNGRATITATRINISPGSISGTVIYKPQYNISIPISNALVSCAGVSTNTDSSGFYYLSDVPEGSQTITVTMSDYRDFESNVTIISNITTTLDIELTPTP